MNRKTRRKAAAQKRAAVSTSAPAGIAVLGSHPQTVMQAPFNGSWKDGKQFAQIEIDYEKGDIDGTIVEPPPEGEWLIWACSPHNVEQRKLPRKDEWFEIHKPIADATRAYPYLRYLENLPKVWMRDKEAISLFPGAEEYPEKEMKERFGPYCFTSSIAFILAKAIVTCERDKIPNIGLWGIMQASQTEYTYQRPGIQNLIWEATKAGINVMAPFESQLFHPPMEKF